MPSCVEKLIREQRVEKQDILAVSPFDLSFASEYVSGYVFLTKDTLGVAVSEPDPQSVRYFRGTKTNKTTMPAGFMSERKSLIFPSTDNLRRALLFWNIKGLNTGFVH